MLHRRNRWAVLGGLPSLVVTVLLTVSGANAEEVIRVAASPDAGTRITDALARARSLREKKPDAGIVIELSPGVHRLTEPVRIGPGDSGAPGKPLVIRGAGRSTRLVGSVALPASNARPKALDRVPSAAKPGVRVYALPSQARASPRIEVPRVFDRQARPVPFELFDDGGPLTPARWPNEGFAVSGAGMARTIRIDAAPWPSLRAAPDLWIAGYWSEDWSFETQPLRSIDVGARSAELDGPPLFDLKSRRRLFLFHAAELLDAPGEWVRDEASGTVLVAPRQPGGIVEASVSQGHLRIDQARHVRIEDLAFARVRDDAIRVTGSLDVVLDRLALNEIAGRAAVFERSVASGIRNSLIDRTGEGGVVLDGGQRASLSPGGLFAENNAIRRFSRLGRTYKPAILLSGVGNIARGNLIADGEHMAIYVRGNDHLIELNEITRVLQETGDAGAIYTGRDWTARGTRITRNFIHDLVPAPGLEIKAVYLDDMASGFRIEENLLLRVSQAVFIGGGRDNAVERNVIVPSDVAIHLDGRGLTWSKAAVLSPASELNRDLAAMPFRSPLWRSRYPRLATLPEEDPGRPLGNRVSGNLLLTATPYRITPEVTPDIIALDGDRVAYAAEGSDPSAPNSATAFAATFDSMIREVGLETIPFADMDRTRHLPSLNR